MTITSVVLGDGTPEGGCGEAWVGVSTDATGSSVISKGNSSFIVFLDSDWLVVGSVGLIWKATQCHRARTLDVF
jgi:hypothetical protein